MEQTFLRPSRPLGAGLWAPGHGRKNRARTGLWLLRAKAGPCGHFPASRNSFCKWHGPRPPTCPGLVRGTPTSWPSPSLLPSPSGQAGAHWTSWLQGRSRESGKPLARQTPAVGGCGAPGQWGTGARSHTAGSFLQPLCCLTLTPARGSARVGSQRGCKLRALGLVSWRVAASQCPDGGFRQLRPR